MKRDRRKPPADAREWARRLCNRALITWLQSQPPASGDDPAGLAPVTVCMHQDGTRNYVVVSAAHTELYAVFLVTTDGRLLPLGTWPETASQWSC